MLVCSLGCASGTTSVVDAASADALIADVRPDAPVPDALVHDAPVPDVRLADALVPDATPIDAVPIDAPVIDASTIDAPVGAACGGRGNAACTGSVYCDWADNSCGATDLSGVCTIRPTACPPLVNYVCACDGQIYNNECLAAEAGVDVSTSDTCQAPPGMFDCGNTFCTQGTQFCQKTVGGAIGSGPRYACMAIPGTCSPADCACLQQNSCGTMCSESADGNFTLICQAA